MTDFDAVDRDCSWCGGEGWEECYDPIQCLNPGCNGTVHPCESCDGRGVDQYIW